MIKILVVDDDLLIRELLSEILLASEKYEVVSAENGQAALELYRQNADIGLILSDINMPVMDGLSLIKELRQEGSPLKHFTVAQTIISSRTKISKKRLCWPWIKLWKKNASKMKTGNCSSIWTIWSMSWRAWLTR